MSDGRRLAVVSHPCVVPENQGVYRSLARRDWDPTLIVPHRWSHAYAAEPLSSAALPGLEGRVRHRRVALPGDAARHFYLPGIGRLMARLDPAIAFVEHDAFSVVAFQMALVMRRLGVPYGVQADENLDRPMPRPARLWRGFVLRNAAYVAARSPRAAEVARGWGARGPAGIVPHALPDWELPEDAPTRGEEFTIGYAGRLVEEKGLLDLARAVDSLEPPVRLLLIGEGPLRPRLEAMPAVEVRTAADQAEMPALYREMDVLALPSLTTATWAEQFGRVLSEALVCEVPVVGSDSGEIPWVIESTGGGWVFPEGDAGALGRVLAEVRASPEEARDRARRGREQALKLFSTDAAARSFDELLTLALA